ncbi:MAG: beta-lactamase family protein [Rhodobacteraceae bacterium]|nr:beta-lactamase family protein [Paracoccaceae bacterium]
MITVEHLLTHRAGLSYGFLLDCPVGKLYREASFRDVKVSLAEFVRRVAALPLALHRRYSVATDVLGRVLVPS